MKKKLLARLFIATAVIVGAVAFTGCGNNNRGSNGGLLQVHGHSFTRQNVKDKYLKSEATCTKKAVYYYSCWCGKKGSETFEYGEVLKPTKGLELALIVGGYEVKDIGAATANELVIPAEYNGVHVISIGSEAFYRCGKIKSVAIPEYVKDIGDYAFYQCSSLTKLTIPDGVTTIGKYAFYECTGLKSVVIGKGVKSIGNSAFYGCRELGSITFNGTKEQWQAVEKGSDWEYGNYNIKFTEESTKQSQR